MSNPNFNTNTNKNSVSTYDVSDNVGINTPSLNSNHNPSMFKDLSRRSITSLKKAHGA